MLWVDIPVGNDAFTWLAQTAQAAPAGGCRGSTDMQLVIKDKNTELGDQFRNLVEDKTSRLARYLDNIKTITVEITHKKTHHPAQSYVVQMTLTVNGHMLRAEERAPDPRSALDSVVDVMQRQIIRYKEKLYTRGRSTVAKEVTLRTAMNGLHSEPEEAATAVAEEPRIVRTKQFTVKPMTAEEATEQMELLGHDFFIFQNETNSQFNILYRRHDGNYGLIEPEIE